MINLLSILNDKLKSAILKSNTDGVPVPLLRDNYSGRGSYTLTMFVISFNIAIITLIGKVTHYLGEVDYSNVMWLLGITGAFYMGRSFRKTADGISVDAINKTEKLEDKGGQNG